MTSEAVAPTWWEASFMGMLDGPGAQRAGL